MIQNTSYYIKRPEFATQLNMMYYELCETDTHKTTCLLPSVSPMWMVQ